MSSLEFEDQNSNLTKVPQSIYKASFLVKHRIAKDEKTAERIYIVALVMLLLLTFGMLWKLHQNNRPKEVQYAFPDEIIQRLPTEIQKEIILRQ